MKFEWDSDKADKNLKKHRVSFQEAGSIFGDSFSITYYDPDHSLKEHRFITIGMSWSGRVLMVAHTDRGVNVRIISARKATQQERRYYEKSKS